MEQPVLKKQMNGQVKTQMNQEGTLIYDFVEANISIFKNHFNSILAMLVDDVWKQIVSANSEEKTRSTPSSSAKKGFRFSSSEISGPNESEIKSKRNSNFHETLKKSISSQNGPKREIQGHRLSTPGEGTGRIGGGLSESTSRKRLQSSHSFATSASMNKASPGRQTAFYPDRSMIRETVSPDPLKYTDPILYVLVSSFLSNYLFPLFSF